MTYQQALSKGTALLEANEVADARIDAWLLLSFVSGLSRERFFLVNQDPIDELTLFKYQEALLKRAQHIPTQYITGEQDFMGLTFWVNEHVLIPRQDTELLVEQALSVIPSGSHILDLCTGSGCVLVSIIAMGQGLSGIGVDISPEALAVARENGSRHVGAKAVFLESDLFAKVTGKYNCIVSNPPYIQSAVIDTLEPEVRAHEPRLALDGSSDGLYFYRRIVSEASNYLTSGGYLLVEIGYDQGSSVSELFTAYGFLEVQVIKDLSGHDRVVRGHL